MYISTGQDVGEEIEMVKRLGRPVRRPFCFTGNGATRLALKIKPRSPKVSRVEELDQSKAYLMDVRHTQTSIQAFGRSESSGRPQKRHEMGWGYELLKTFALRRLRYLSKTLKEDAKEDRRPGQTFFDLPNIHPSQSCHPPFFPLTMQKWKRK